MEKRAFIALVLSLLILIVYQEWITRQYAPPPAQPEQEETPKSEPVKPVPEAAPKKVEAPPALPAAAVKTEEVRVETDLYRAVFVNQGARLKSFILKQYRTSTAENSPPVEMISHEPEMPYPLGVQLPGTTPGDDHGISYSTEGGDLRLHGNKPGALVFRGRGPGGEIITKRFTFDGSTYAFKLELTVEGTSGAQPATLFLTSPAKGPTEDSHFEGLLGLVNGKVIREGKEELEKGHELAGPISWAGFGYTYFLQAVLPESAEQGKVAVRQSGQALILGMTPEAGKNGAAAYTVFIGPKDLDLLKSFNKGLERSIDFGYFAFISLPLLYALRFSHQFTASYGIDIILLTVVIKLLTAPLTHKSYTSMKKMQKLQPQMEKLKEKFKDDREKLNKEIMELYRRNGVNPFGGCLPMLLQIPVFIGLYNALLTPIELRHAPFLWIQDLSRPDWESLPFHVAGYSVGLPVLTILMGASMFVQQWMTPTAGDPNQRKMMLMMPIIFTFMFINFPSGLTIYWLVNNVLSIAQQYFINRMDS
jgi:YidC/Oxa1 family membrane protein insertase